MMFVPEHYRYPLSMGNPRRMDLSSLTMTAVRICPMDVASEWAGLYKGDPVKSAERGEFCLTDEAVAVLRTVGSRMDERERDAMRYRTALRRFWREIDVALT